MKKLILTLGVIGGLFTAKSQTKTDEAVLNVRLYPLQTIFVNTAQKEVNLDYTNTSDYANGVAVDQKNHLTVYSTGAFNVTVNSKTDKLTTTAGSQVIEAADITVTPSEGSANALSGATFTPVKLSTTPTTFISSTTGGVNKNFNVNYAAKGDMDKYVNKYYNSQNPTVYTTQVVYTIAAQ